MTLYAGILLVAFFIAMGDSNGKSATLSLGNKNIFNGKIMISAILMYAFMFVLTAFRAETIGKDTASYVRVFNNVISSQSISSVSVRMEIGFKYFCSIIGRFTSNPQALIITSTIICYAFTGIFIFSSTDHHGIMVAIFSGMMFRNYCSGIRQSMAFSICLIAYMMIKKDKYYKGAFLIAIAATIHTTALVSLFYFIIPIVMKNKRFKYTALGLLVVGAIVARRFGLLDVVTKFSNYYEGYYSESGRAKIGIMSCILTMTVTIYVFISYIIVKKKTNDNDVEWNDDEAIWFGYALLLIGVINFFSNNASRLMWYFELPFIVCLINRASEMKNPERQRVVLSIVALYQFVFIINLILRPYYFALIPYKFWEM